MIEHLGLLMNFKQRKLKGLVQKGFPQPMFSQHIHGQQLAGQR